MKKPELMNFWALVLAVGGSTPSWAQPVPATPPRCEQFLLPVQGDQILVMPREAYEIIRKHSILRLAARLREKGSRLKFIFHSQGGGYDAQSAMLKRVLPEIFPESFSEPQKSVRIRRIEFDLSDSPLHHSLLTLPFSPTWKDTATLQVARLKPGNPLLPADTKRAVRQKLKIPEHAHVLHVYFDGDEMPTLEHLFEFLPVKPDLMILSPTGPFS
ncbi:MAG: hypothetical protein EBX52_07885, partial [Proteobacteria bacterium]|nr:hypothetical protein [Pseudomonadota bacterium]